MPYVVLAVLEESDCEVPAPLTHEQRIARSAEGWSPTETGAQSIFEVKAPAKRWTP